MEQPVEKMEHSKVNITCLPVNPAWRITFLGLRSPIDLKNWHFWSLFLPKLILLTTRAIWPIGNTKLLAITAGILYKNIRTYFLHCETSAPNPSAGFRWRPVARPSQSNIRQTRIYWPSDMASQLPEASSTDSRIRDVAESSRERAHPSRACQC